MIVAGFLVALVRIWFGYETVVERDQFKPLPEGEVITRGVWQVVGEQDQQVSRVEIDVVFGIEVTTFEGVTA